MTDELNFFEDPEMEDLAFKKVKLEAIKKYKDSSDAAMICTAVMFGITNFFKFIDGFMILSELMRRFPDGPDDVIKKAISCDKLKILESMFKKYLGI